MDEQPFLGFHDQITLSKDEVLDAVAALEEVIWDLGAAGHYDQAEQLAHTREVLLNRLRRR